MNQHITIRDPANTMQEGTVLRFIYVMIFVIPVLDFDHIV
jgi:hypothetical protein